MDGWKARVTAIMEGAKGRSLTTEEVREVMAAMTPEERLPALLAVRQLMNERPERGEGLSPHQRSRAALQA